MVRTQRDRNRVSYVNRPVGSSSEASISPRGSLTTNVLPSRILTRSSLMGLRPPALHRPRGTLNNARACGSASADSWLPRVVWSGEDALEVHEELRVALDAQLAAQYRGHGVGSSLGDRFEERALAADDGIGLLRAGDRFDA